MQKPLNPLSFKQNAYERPAQEWICGRTAEGRPCPLGPDQRGHCRATGECLPVRKGDRWICMRTEASGGKCPEGPRPDGACCRPIPPCQPVRSLRRLRGLAVLLVVALTLGALFYLLDGKSRARWTDPGELSAVHGISTGNGAASHCDDCHSVNQKTTGSAQVLFFAHRQLADSQLCLKCHTLGEHPLQPHAVAAPTLTKLTQKAVSVASGGKAPLVLQISHKLNALDPHGSQLDCAVCHQEHHGREASLTQFADAQCQVCHAAQFRSFTQGHPEFTQYPYQRRTRIFFDHSKHLDEYFTKDKEHAPTSCQDCHMAGAKDRQMLVKNFQETCAACHAGQIRGDGMEFKGIAFFSIPELDVDTLESKGHRIGEWPRADGKLTPFMELLLGTDENLRAAMEKLRGVELGDLSKASADKLDAAEQLAWGVKSLLFDLTTGGHDMLFKRIGMDVSTGRNEMAPELSGRISQAAVLAAQQEWMPHLLTEISDYRKGIKPSPPQPPTPAPVPPTSPKPAVPTDKGDLLDITPPPAAPKDKQSQSIPDTGDLLSAPTPPTPAPKAPAHAGDDLSLLGGVDDLSKAAATPGKTKAPSDGSGDLLSTSSETSPPNTPAGDQATTVPLKSAEDWTATGGWYRPAKSFALFYRPAGHADSFLKAWLTVVAGMSTEAPANDALTVFRKLADPAAPGACMKCHTADAVGGAIQVNWLPAHPEPHAHLFTVFNHTAHFSLLGDRGCQTCHRLAPESEYAKFFATADGTLPDDPTRFASSFAPLSKAVCVECHKPQIAGDNCLLCHRYHTGTFAPNVHEAAGFHSAANKESDVERIIANGHQ